MRSGKRVSTGEAEDKGKGGKRRQGAETFKFERGDDLNWSGGENGM